MSTPAKIEHQDVPKVVLVGRVNVGKSTLFNRLIEEQKAIVSPIAGTTRTNNEGFILWRGKNIRLIDTGGLSFDEVFPLEKEILIQSDMAIAEANLIVFVTDARVGIISQDRELARRLRKITKVPILVVANKVDTTKIEDSIAKEEWAGLGFGEPLFASASNGRQLGDLLDIIFTKLKILSTAVGTSSSDSIYQPESAEPKNPQIRVSIIGKPNVGKSSLFNKLIGLDKVIVSPMPHTTREPHDTDVTYEYEENGTQKIQAITFVDTAGIRRKTKVTGELEQIGVQKSIDMISKSDIVLFVIDGTEALSSQDLQLGGLLEKHARSVIILLNKWDMAAEHSEEERNKVIKMIGTSFPHLNYAPILLVSGKTGYRTHDVFPLLMKVCASRQLIIPDAELAIFMKKIISKHKPARGRGSNMPKLMGFRQTATNPPVFELLIKQNTSLHISYVYYLQNKLREQYNFIGTPVIIRMTKMRR